MKKSIFALAILFTSFACSPKDDPEFNDELEATHEKVLTLGDNQWNLSELNGNAITLSGEFNKFPFISFEADSSRVSGNAGCNNFFGSYELGSDNKISFSQMGATMMACPNLELEGEFLKAIENTKSFKVEDKSLLFVNEEGQSVVKFENGPKSIED